MGTAVSLPLVLVGAGSAGAAGPLVQTESSLSSPANHTAVGQSVNLTDAVDASLFGTPVVPGQLATVVGSGLNNPQMIARDTGGNIYFAGSSGNDVSVLPDASGNLYGVPVTGSTVASLVSSGLSTPTGIAVDAAGDLYISNYGNNTVSLLPAASGTLFGQTVTASTLMTLVPAAAGLSQPEGIALDAAGNLYISERTGAIAVLPVANGALFGRSVTADAITTIVSSGLNTDFNLAFDAAGNLYIANQGTGSVLVLPMASGTLYGVPVTADTLATVVSGLNTPVGLAFDSAGDLYVSDWGTATVSVLPQASGTLYGTNVTANTLATLVSSGVQGPTGLAFDGTADLYIADHTASGMDVLPSVMGTLPASGETVDFRDGGTDIPGCQAVELATSYPYVATCTTSFSVPGTHSITAIYSGDSNFATSTAPALSEAVYGSDLYAAPSSTGAGDCSDLADACTIPAAITDATVSGDTINLAGGTYALSESLPVSLTGSLIFQAEAGATPVLNGQGTTQVMTIAAGSNVSLMGVNVENGHSLSGGGGIYNNGTLFIEGSTISGNTDATSASSSAGAGLSNAGQATVVNSTFSGNTESNNAWGGAIANQVGGTLNVYGSTFSGNAAAGGCACGAAGAIANFGSATIEGSTFWANVTNGSDGGAVENQGALTVIGNTFAGGNASSNHAMGGGDLFDQAGATVYAAGNLFGDTLTDPCYVQAGATWQDDGYNAAGGATQCLGAATDVADPSLPGDLGTLVANGGGIDTVLPATGAPEVGAVPDPTNLTVNGGLVTLCPVTGQTGTLSNDENCSIGSLFVASAPGAPTGPSATPVTSGVSLTWTAPATNGTATVTGYDIYVGASPGGEGITPVNATPANGTSYTVSGLTGYSSPYYFTVAAVDGSGISAASSEVQAVPVRPATSSPTATTSTTVPSTTVPSTTVPSTATTSTTVPSTTTSSSPRTTTTAGRTTTTAAHPRPKKSTTTTAPATPTTATAATTTLPTPTTSIPSSSTTSLAATTTSLVAAATTTVPGATATTIVGATTSTIPGATGTTVPGATTSTIAAATSVPSASTTAPTPATTVVPSQAPLSVTTTMPPAPGTTVALAAPTTIPPLTSAPTTTRPSTLPPSAGPRRPDAHRGSAGGPHHRAGPGSPAKVAISFHFAVGQRLAGKQVHVYGVGLPPGSTVLITLHSVPFRLGTSLVSPAGTFAGTVAIPAGTAAGDHHVEVSVRAPSGPVVSSSRYFQLGSSDIVTRVQPAGSEGAAVPSWVSDPGPQPQVLDGKVVSPYVPAQHPKQVMPIEIGAVVLVGLAAAGGASFAVAGTGLGARGGQGESSAGHKSKKTGKVGSASHKYGVVTEDEKRAGDRSRTWQWPGVAKLDKISRELPGHLSRYSPLLCRLVVDGVGTRAVAGTLSLLLPLAGLGLGVAAVASVGGSAMPPSFGLLTAIIALSVFDALAGAAAAFVFFIGVLASGGVTSMSSLRLLLASCVLFFVAPLAASKARSLRRKTTEGLTYLVDRAGDFIIAALVAAYGIEKLVSGLKPLATLDLPVASHAAAIAIVVLVAVLARYLVETVVVHCYPYRLSEVATQDLPRPTTLQRHISTVFQTVLFVFVAMPVFGSAWELYAGAFVLWSCAMISMYPDFLPDVPWAKKLVPGGYVKSVVNLVVGSALAALVAVSIPKPSEQLSLGLLIFMVPGVILCLGDGLARNAKKLTLDWASRAGGAAVLVVGVLLAQGIVTINW